jgi:aminopeptidase-like protein
VGVNLGLAERLVREPLQRTEVWVLCSGCEEVGCYGMLAFLKAHKDELRRAYFIDLEGVGVGQLYYASREGMTRTYRSHPELVAMAEKVAARRPGLIAGPKVLPAGYTETGVVVKEGLKGITLVALSRHGFLPYWHQPGDTIDKLEEETLAKAHEFVWEMMREIDGLT